MDGLKKLHEISFTLKLAVLCGVLVLAGGYAASLKHLVHHLSQKDDVDGLSEVDVIGTYSGIDRPAPMLRALESDSHKAWLEGKAPESDIALLKTWLSGTKQQISTGFDNLPPGAAESTRLPADVLYDHCTSCHAAGATEGNGIGKTVSLERWPDVEKTVYSKKLTPITIDILATSTHTHALSMPLFLALAAGLLLLTAWPRRLRHGLTLCAFFGLLLDISGMWLARLVDPFFVNFIYVGGGLMGLGFGFTLVLVLIGLWFPRGER